VFPIGDDDSSRRTVPIVTYALIAMNVLFFFVEQSGGEAFVKTWAFVPSRVFYLLCGLAATFAQLAFSLGSHVPNLGASGAIAGVLGAYILLFPQGSVRVLQGQRVVQVPALIVIGLWIALQLFSGIGSVASSAQSGGVAYMAHIGGFLAGVMLTFVFRDSRMVPS
jgi:membrane associated rhomboid family serine protease